MKPIPNEVGDPDPVPVAAPGAVYALAAAEGLAFAACADGLFRSDDGALTWRDCFEVLALPEPLFAGAVAVSPDFAADHTVFAGVNGGVLRSVDGGLTWGTAMLPSPPPLVAALAISPNYMMDGTGFAATVEDGVFHTTDRGATWVSWNFALLDLRTTCLAVSPAYAEDETLFAGSDTGIFCSTNGGRAWREVDFPMDLGPVLSLAVSPGFAHDRTLFAGAESAGLFRSQDGGATWVQVYACEDPVNALLCRENHGSLEVVAACGSLLLRSTDGGDAWEEWPGYEPGEESITALAQVAEREMLVGFEESGVRRVGLPSPDELATVG